MASVCKEMSLTKSLNDDLLNLDEMLKIIGDKMSNTDLLALRYIYNQVIPSSVLDSISSCTEFLLHLKSLGRIDESNFTQLLHVLHVAMRHDLIPYVTLRKRKTVQDDPVDMFLEKNCRCKSIVPFSNSFQANNHGSSNASTSSPPSTSKHTSDLTSQDSQNNVENTPHQTTNTHQDKCEKHKSLKRSSSAENADCSSVKRRKKDDLKRKIKKTIDSQDDCLSLNGGDENPALGDNICSKKITCDIRLRVRAEYCEHQTALEGNVMSNKPTLIERQFEKFMQANTILKSRDLGSIICDIKFSELTYLDAFWRDYINGSLLEALKGVFITESLRQAVGHEAIKLLVNVDEDDYLSGRERLLENLKES